MRVFGGLSFGLGRARFGISRRGNLWGGARASAGPLYLGTLGSTGAKAGPPPRGEKGRLTFTIEDDGTIMLGGVTVNRDGLEAVVAASQLAERTHAARVDVPRSREEADADARESFLRDGNHPNHPGTDEREEHENA